MSYNVRMNLLLPLEVVSKLTAIEGIDAGRSSQRLLKWS